MNCECCTMPANYRCECNGAYICSQHLNDHLNRSERSHKIVKIASPTFINEIFKRVSIISKMQQEIHSKTLELQKQILISSSKALENLEASKKICLALYSSLPEDRISTKLLTTCLKKKEINISVILQEIKSCFSKEFIEEIDINPPRHSHNNIIPASEAIPYPTNNRMTVNPRDSFLHASNYTMNTTRNMPYNPFEEKTARIISKNSFEEQDLLRNQYRRFSGEGPGYLVSNQGHTDEVHAVAISTTNLCATGGKDRSLKIWDLTSFQLIKSIEGFTSCIRAICIASDDTLVFSAGDDAIIRVHRIDNGANVAGVTAGRGVIRTLSLASDNIRVLFGSENGKIGFWGTDAKSVMKYINAHGNGVLSLAIANDQNSFISGGKDNNVKIWSFPAMGEKMVLKGHKSFVQAVVIQANNVYAVSAGVDMKVFLWNIGRKSVEHTFEDHESFVFSLALTADQNSIVSSGADGTIFVFNIASKSRETYIKSIRKSDINSLAVTSDNKIVSVDNQSFIRVWDLQTSRQIAEITGVNPKTYRYSIGPK